MNTDHSATHVMDVTTSDFLTAVVERSRTTPVLVDFWAAWCGPCRALVPVLEKLADEYAGGFVLAKVDTEKETALATQFQIRSIPTVMLFNAGTVVTGFQGALPAGQIREFLTKHGVVVGGAVAVSWSDIPEERVVQLRAAVADAPARDDLALELGLAELAVGRFEEASRLLEALPVPRYSDAKAMRGRARITLQRRVHAGLDAPAHTSAIRAVLDGQVDVGLQQLLELLREEKHDEDSPARSALVDSLQLLDDDARVRDWRRRMASVLF